MAAAPHVLDHTCGLPLRRPMGQSASIWVLGDDQRSLALGDVLVHEVVEAGPGGIGRATCCAKYELLPRPHASTKHALFITDDL
jgi:hypothetical protein